MSIDYAEIADDVLAAIEEVGSSVVLTRMVSEYDVSTGDSDGAESKSSGKGVRVDYKISEIDGTLILVGDVRLFLDAVNLIEPRPGDSITFDSKTFIVIRCNPVKPATKAVAYIVQTRAG